MLILHLLYVNLKTLIILLDLSKPVIKHKIISRRTSCLKTKILNEFMRC